MTEYVEHLTVGELRRIAKVHLLYLQKDRERSRRYYQQNSEARRKANLERYHRNKKRGGTDHRESKIKENGPSSNET